MSKKIEFQYINYLYTGILYKLHGNVIAIHIHAHVHPEDSYKVKTPHQRKKRHERCLPPTTHGIVEKPRALRN